MLCEQKSDKSLWNNLSVRRDKHGKQDDANETPKSESPPNPPEELKEGEGSTSSDVPDETEQDAKPPAEEIPKHVPKKLHVSDIPPEHVPGKEDKDPPLDPTSSAATASSSNTLVSLWSTIKEKQLNASLDPQIAFYHHLGKYLGTNK